MQLMFTDGDEGGKTSKGLNFSEIVKYLRIKIEITTYWI